MKPIKSIIILVLYTGLISLLHYWLMKMDLNAGQQLIVEGSIACIFFILWGIMDYFQRQNINATNLFCVGALLRVGIGGIYTGVLIAADYPWLLDIRGYVPVDTADEGLFLMNIGSILFLAGIHFYEYLEQRKKKLPNADLQVPRFPKTWLIWGLVLAGWSIRIFRIKLGVAGQVLMLLPSAGTYLFATAALSGSKKKAQYWTCVFLVVIVELWFSRYSAMREASAFVFLPILLALTSKVASGKKVQLSGSGKAVVVKSRKSKMKLIGSSLLAAMLAAFIVFIFFPAASLVKEGRFARVDKALMYVLRNVKENTAEINRFPNHGIYAFGTRMANIVSSSSVIVRLVEEDMKPNYDPLQNIMAGFVPRILWKNKPVIAKGGEFAQFLNPDVWDETSFALTSPGELYWSYRWLGMIAGMFVMGLIVNMFWRTSSKHIFENIFNIVMVIVIAQESIRWFEASASATISLLFTIRIAIFVITGPIRMFFTRRKVSYNRFRYRK